jgi:hypothetical protein
MKIPAPMIPPITAIVVPNNPSWRASPPWFVLLLLDVVSGIVIQACGAGGFAPFMTICRVLYHSY